MVMRKMSKYWRMTESQNDIFGHFSTRGYPVITYHGRSRGKYSAGPLYKGTLC